jgi:hypothetical protein
MIGDELAWQSFLRPSGICRKSATAGRTASNGTCGEVVCSRSSPSRLAALQQDPVPRPRAPTFARGASFPPSWPEARQTRKGPARGPSGRTGRYSNHATAVRLNLPRSALANRELVPFVVISRAIAE